MGINFLRRKLAVAKALKFLKDQDVFYIVWNKGDSEFFLCDAQNDGKELHWSVHRDHALKFDNGMDALGFCKEINSIKRGSGIIELKATTEKVESFDESDMYII